MAKANKSKRGKQRRSAFYEAMPTAMPMVVTPPLALPEALQHFDEAARNIAQKWQARTRRLASINRNDLKRIGHWLGVHAMAMGLATTNGLIFAARNTVLALRYSATAAVN